MKKLLSLLALVPILSFGQVSSWRTNPPTQSSTTQSTPRVSTQPQQPNVSNWRNTPQQNNREVNIPRQSYNNRNGRYYVPFYDNRWNRWGAPMYGYNYFTPGFYYNNWGYREPVRVYHYTNGKVDTVKGQKIRYSFGIQKTTDKQIGGWLTIGRKSYFITEYSQSYERDNSTYFQYGNITQIDFPLIDDLVETKVFYVGLGKKIKRTGVHLMVGTVNEVVKYRGRDAIGFITFPKYTDNFMTVKMGVIHDFKTVSFKLDVDPILKTTTFGLGLNF